MSEQTQTGYQIKLPQFEGPFDLLLFFIERDELDIYNIPIAKITDDFLAYIREMELLNIELASEFILVASSLMRIKAKMLLPRKELDEQGNEIDPREELVQRLLEYKRYKEVSETLKDLEHERSMLEQRGNISKDVRRIAEHYTTESELHSITLFKLLKAFQKVVERHENKKNQPEHQVIRYAYTIADEKKSIISRLRSASKTTFESVFEECKDRIHAIFTFLAMLELIQEQKLGITMGDGYNNFWVEGREGSAE